MDVPKTIHTISSILSLMLFRIASIIAFIYLLKTEKYYASFFILVFIVVIETSAYMSKLGLKKIEIKRTLSSKRIFPESEIFYKILIQNSKAISSAFKWYQPFPPSFEIKKNDTDIKSTQEAEGNIHVRRYAKSDINLKLIVRKRGYYRLPPLDIQSKDVFGLFKRGKTCDESLELIVYPKLVNLKKIRLKRSDFSGLNREERPYLLDPIMFVGLREYTPDTPSKLINWKASAHKDILLSKIIESSSNLKLLITIDMDFFENFKDHKEKELMFEKALSIAATIATKADEAKISFGFAANFSQIYKDEPPMISIDRSDDQILTVLEALARANCDTMGKLADLIACEPSFIPWGTSLITIGKLDTRFLPSSIGEVVSYPLTPEE
jgi:uncharacterized protein (DUF58 family)